MTYLEEFRAVWHLLCHRRIHRCVLCHYIYHEEGEGLWLAWISIAACGLTMAYLLTYR